MAPRITACALAAATLLACMPTKRECTWGEVEEVPGACYTKDGEIWLEGEVMTLEAGADANLDDAGEPDTGEGTDADAHDTGMTSEAGLDSGLSESDAAQPDGGDAADGSTGCNNDLECPQAGSSRFCNLESHSCVECLPGALERTQCTNGKACAPDSFSCTGAPRDSLYQCMPCISDTECAEVAGSVHRCVPLIFQGRALRNYCLRVAPDTNACPNQSAVLKQATSVLGVEDAYCVPDEQRTTCEAVGDFKHFCNTNDECGADGVADGLCVGNPGGRRCTYACGTDADCLEGINCIGTPGTKYCDPN